MLTNITLSVYEVVHPIDKIMDAETFVYDTSVRQPYAIV